MNIKHFILCATAALFTCSVNAQLAKKGMTIKENNFTSFTKQSVDNIKSWKKYNSKKFYNHPEFGVLPSNSPEGNIVEDLSKRTEKSRYFVNLDQPSEFYIQKGYYPINYQDENGFWRAIETGLSPTENQVYQSRYYYEPSGFNFNQNNSFVKTREGKIDFNQWTLYKKEKGKIEFLSNPDWSDYTVGEDGVYINNIFNGIDAEMIVNKGSIETNFIMKTNEFGTFDALLFRDSFEANQPLELSFSSNTETSEDVGDIDVKKDGKPALTMFEGVGYLKASPKVRTSLAYAINDQQVDVIVPHSWIEENIEENNLVIDPLVTGVETTAMADIFGSMYSASCNFGNSCDYDMSLTFPPYATITNTTTDFDYKAAGSCYFEDGATRFASGSCISPDQTNYYWFCNSFGQGTCNGNDTPIYDDVSSCLPAPSCTSEDIPFQLQFFRSCYGVTGCDNDCIGAVSDWVVTVTGKTIEFDDLTNSIDLSDTEICLGESFTVSTEGNYGVPSYTYNWSLSPSGTPSLGTSNNESIELSDTGTFKIYGTVTDDCNQTVVDSVEVKVNDTTLPDFPPLGPFCMGEQASLPTTSDNGITGTWTPGVNTNFAGTQTYTFNPDGCSPSIQRDITILKAPFGQISDDVQACEGDTVLPKITFTGANTNAPYTFLYAVNGDTMQITTSNNTNDTTIAFPTDTSGVYNVELIQVDDDNCFRVINKFATVTIYDTPIPDFDATSYTGEPGDEITLQNTSSDENAIEWFHYLEHYTSWGSQENFSHVFNESGDHQITLLAENDHCEDSITKTITILPKEASYILPNVFTPNGDGTNDLLDFHFENVKKLDLVILNRWGNVIYETDDPQAPWNGKINNSGAQCDDGTYFYKFTVEGLSGSESKENGFVQLVND